MSLSSISDCSVSACSERVDPDVQEDFGRSPMSYAAENGHEKNREDTAFYTQGGSNFGVTLKAGFLFGLLHGMALLILCRCCSRLGRLMLIMRIQRDRHHGCLLLLHTADSLLPLAPQGLVDPNAKDNMSWTPPFHAAMHGQAQVIRQLLAAEADPVPVDSRQITPLMEAAGTGHVDVVQVLLETGRVRIDATTRGQTALMLSEFRRRGTVVALLKEVAESPSQ